MGTMKLLELRRTGTVEVIHAHPLYCVYII